MTFLPAVGLLSTGGLDAQVHALGDDAAGVLTRYLVRPVPHLLTAVEEFAAEHLWRPGVRTVGVHLRKLGWRGPSMAGVQEARNPCFHLHTLALTK